MQTLKRIYAAPHELLHVLALLIIGRKPVFVGGDHVIIPGDLTTAQYVFVAGLPALVFFGLTALGAVWLLNAPSPSHAGIAAAIILAAGFGAAGTMGDLQLIMARLMQGERKQ
jgi:hypothetical protein